MKKKYVWIIISSLIIFSYFVLLGSGNPTFSNMFKNIVFVRSRVQILALIVLFVFFILLLCVTGSYWFSIATFLSLVIVIAIANFEKYHLRNEGILPSDLLMITSINKIFEMVNPWLVFFGVFLILGLFILNFKIFKNISLNISWLIRIIGVFLSTFMFYGLANIQKQGTLYYKVGQIFGDNPIYFDSAEAVESNGPIINFFNNLNVESMAKPTGYSRQTMENVAKKYMTLAEQINKQQKNSKTGTVIYILSESFSDPTKVPGVELSKDPIPFTRKIMNEYIGGEMVSDGYGGGTANMEYQALTGLSMGNFSATLPTPYTQLVPHQKRVYSVNSTFKKSVAIHPYSGTLYSRKIVFKKMGFDRFYYLNHGYPNKYATKIDNNPYVSDMGTYKFLLNKLKSNNDDDMFYQVSTMQNHMPYNHNYYSASTYKAYGSLSTAEKSQIETYSQGIHYTDNANRYLLHELSKIKKNITVVFYGDHLPGIYSHLDFNKYGIQAHETPYFIWSNHRKVNKKATQGLIGTYGFSSALSMATNTKISPYDALLSKVNQELPIIASKVSADVSDPNLPDGGMNLVSKQSRKIVHINELTQKQRSLLRDYQLVQYDFTAGNYYIYNSMTKK